MVADKRLQNNKEEKMEKLMSKVTESRVVLVVGMAFLAMTAVGMFINHVLPVL